MKAIEITDVRQMHIVEIDNPVPGNGEVLLRINYVGFCGSDLNTYLGRNALAKKPVIPGHEISATIEALGEGVPESLKKGLVVTVDPYTGCGTCSACLSERANACRHNQTLGVQRDGAMREWLVMPWQKIIPAAGLDPRHVALIEPLSVGFHAVSRAQVTDIDVVMVIGCGMIGMGAIVRAAMRGAKVIAVDIDDDKLAVARQMGAAHSINSKTENLADELASLTDGEGPNVVVEAVGNPFTQRQALESVAFTGRIVFIGYAPAETSVLTKLIVQKEIDLRGSRNAKPADFRAVIGYMQNNKSVSLDALISNTVVPEEAPKAMTAWAEQPSQVFRILVDF